MHKIVKAFCVVKAILVFAGITSPPAAISFELLHTFSTATTNGENPFGQPDP